MYAGKISENPRQGRCMILWACGDKRKTIMFMHEPASKRTKLSYVRVLVAHEGTGK